MLRFKNDTNCITNALLIEAYCKSESRSGRVRVGCHSHRTKDWKKVLCSLNRCCVVLIALARISMITPDSKVKNKRSSKVRLRILFMMHGVQVHTRELIDIVLRWQYIL